MVLFNTKYRWCFRPLGRDVLGGDILVVLRVYSQSTGSTAHILSLGGQRKQLSRLREETAPEILCLGCAPPVYGELWAALGSCVSLGEGQRACVRERGKKWPRVRSA